MSATTIRIAPDGTLCIGDDAWAAWRRDVHHRNTQHRVRREVRRYNDDTLVDIVTNDDNGMWPWAARLELARRGVTV